MTNQPNDKSKADARNLMQGADWLSGARPGMKHDEIRAAMEAATPEVQKLRHLINITLGRYLPDMSEGKPSPDERAKARVAIGVLVAENPSLERLINRDYPDWVHMISGRKPGRPRKHADKKAAQRAASRAYRSRRSQMEPGPEGEG